jgi:gamma-glutamylcyclotransferase (GGCT)/AIG2-like uncharacterized protein YtfP
MTKVFVYGTLKPGHRNHSVIKDLILRMVPGYVQGLRLVDLGSFPGAVEHEGSEISGWLLTLADEEVALMRLDRLEGAPTLYRREETEVELVNGDREQAWIYILNTSYMRQALPVVEGGCW